MKLSPTLTNGIRALTLTGLASIVLVSATLEAKTFRWASAGDILTMDPHSQNEGLNNPMNGHVYDPLLTRDEHMALEA